MRLRPVVLLAAILVANAWNWANPEPPAAIKVTAPTVESMKAQLEQEQKQRQYDAAENIAARILRQHCGGNDEWAEAAARAAVDERVSVRLVAGAIAVESTCRANAESPEHAIGLMQVVPKVHHLTREQLLDPEFNVRYGTHYLGGLVRRYGVAEGLHHYNGMGVGCDACDGAYPNKVLLVAGLAIS